MKKPQSGFLLIPFNKIEPIELIRQNSNETVNSNWTVSIFGTTRDSQVTSSNIQSFLVVLLLMIVKLLHKSVYHHKQHSFYM